MSESKEWYEGRANGLYSIDLQLRNLINVYHEGVEDFEAALVDFSRVIRADLVSTENKSIELRGDNAGDDNTSSRGDS